jgi:hypothetical protein
MAPATRLTRSIGDVVRERLRDAPDDLPDAPRDEAPRADDELLPAPERELDVREPLALREERELEPRDEEREELRDDLRDDLREEPPRRDPPRPLDDFLLEPDRPPREPPPDLFLVAIGVLIVRSWCRGCVQDSRT